MCMNHYEDSRLTNNVINLTSVVIKDYDYGDDGTVRHFYPRKRKKSKATKIPKILKRSLADGREMGNPIVHYVVDQKMFQKIKKTGRNLDDIAVLVMVVDGAEKDMTKMYWGRDLSVPVLIHARANTTPEKHL